MGVKGVIGLIPDLEDEVAHDTANMVKAAEPQRVEKVVSIKKESAKDNNKTLRAAGGVIWEDPSLSEWNPSDYRIFVGDLGRDVSEELLFSTFHDQFPSTTKAKVIKDKRSGKSKGFGFVAMSDEGEFKMAMRSMHGKYIGSRPVKLKKSSWSDRNIDTAEVKLMKQVGYKVVKKH